MMTRLSTVAAFTAISLLAVGCASQYDNGLGICDSTISKLGQDTYMAQDPCTGKSEVEHAGAYCARMGKEVMVTNMVRTSPEVHQTIFRCLSPRDSGYQRPDYQKSPDVIIQDNRGR
jgi:hypothetical protein